MMIYGQDDQATVRRPKPPVTAQRPVRPPTVAPGATTVAGAPRPRTGAPTAPGIARPMAPGNQAPAPIRPAAPGSMITTTAQNFPPPQQSGGLRDQVYTPGGDPRLQGAQNATDAAASAVQNGPNFSTMAQGFTPTETGRAAQYASAQDDALAALGGPSRTDAALTALDDFDKRGAEALQQRFRSIGQNAARLGRLGMGDTGQEVVDAGRRFEQDRQMARNDLIRSVLEGDINDRFRRVDATSGLRRGESDIDARLRGEGRDVAGTELDDRYRRLGASAGYETDIFNQGRANRDEFRTERGRQDSLGQLGVENRIRERELGNNEMDQRFRQALARYGIGQEGIPRLDELLMQYGGA